MLNDCVIGLPEGGVVCCRFWGDECVVYNELSGETHLIDGMGAQIFKVVSEKAATRTVLLQNIESVFELEMDFDREGFLDKLILQYQQLDLLAVMENSSA